MNSVSTGGSRILGEGVDGSLGTMPSACAAVLVPLAGDEDNHYGSKAVNIGFMLARLAAEAVFPGATTLLCMPSALWLSPPMVPVHDRRYSDSRGQCLCWLIYSRCTCQAHHIPYC